MDNKNDENVIYNIDIIVDKRKILCSKNPEKENIEKYFVLYFLYLPYKRNFYGENEYRKFFFTRVV